MRIRNLLPYFALFCGLLLAPAATQADTIARCGEGWLEDINGYPVLHLKGTPWEMGYQHGALLKERVRRNLLNIVALEQDNTVEIAGLTLKPSDAIRSIVTLETPYVPEKYFQEMEGLAAGAEMEREEVRLANFLPELFHCSGFAIMNTATADGTLYHGRVLDYAVDWGLQDHAVIIVAEPDGEIPFVNVTYAGFIGSVTGMNARSVSIGEMGGGGIGYWSGMPMALLVREALQRGETLDEVLAIFRETQRTCEYFYVVADGKTNQAVGMEASHDVMDVIRPGEAHALLPHPVPDCALLSAGDRYEELVRRVRANHGKFTPETALHLMDRGVAMRSNLHNVLFEPETTRFWVANAAGNGGPAADQPYHAFRLTELLSRQPDSDSTEIPLLARSVGE